jgi:hypothetical protein
MSKTHSCATAPVRDIVKDQSRTMSFARVAPFGDIQGLSKAKACDDIRRPEQHGFPKQLSSRSPAHMRSQHMQRYSTPPQPWTKPVLSRAASQRRPDPRLPTN